MATEAVRAEAATALRDLIHTFAARDGRDDELRALVADAKAHTAELATTDRRDRMALMRARVGEGGGFPGGPGEAGFSDRAVGGASNPTGVDLDVAYEGDEVIARVVFRRAFEGPPGRAHGGIVAAAFDDVTGFVIGMLREPAFTGELTVRYLAPVPVDEPLVMRARFDGRERRKLFISADAYAGDNLVATCRAIYITVDPASFAGAPDPR